MNLLLAKPGIDLNTKVEHGTTILALFCIVDNHEAVTKLLANPDVDKNVKDDYGCTPIFAAAAQCHIKTLKVMLESPYVDMDVKCDRGMGLEDQVGSLRGSEEEKKKCLDMIREEKLKRMKAGESEESKGTEIEKMKRVNLREVEQGEGDKNCGGDEHFDANDSANSNKKSPDHATTEKTSFKSAQIIFDATDMGKGFKKLRLNAATPIRDIKKLFQKHLGLDEETFKMCFNNREVNEETPHELFGNNLDGEDNVISIVKAVREDEGAVSDDKLESIPPEKEADHALASNAQNGQKEVNAEKKAKRIKPKCIRASCRNQGQHRCMRCKTVYYCQQECLSEDWPNHKVHCDYVHKGSKDYAYEGNSVPHDPANDDPEETGNSGATVEEVD